MYNLVGFDLILKNISFAKIFFWGSFILAFVKKSLEQSKSPRIIGVISFYSLPVFVTVLAKRVKCVVVFFFGVRRQNVIVTEVDYVVCCRVVDVVCVVYVHRKKKLYGRILDWLN